MPMVHLQPLGLSVQLLVPAGTGLSHIVRDLAIKRDDETEDKLGYGHGVFTGAIRHKDSAIGGALHFDAIVTRPGPHDERK